MTNMEKKLISDEVGDIAFLLGKHYINQETAVAKLYALCNELRKELKEDAQK